MSFIEIICIRMCTFKFTLYNDIQKCLKDKIRTVVSRLLSGRHGPVVISLASQVEGPRFESRRDLNRSDTGCLLSIGASVANVIKPPC